MSVVKLINKTQNISFGSIFMKRFISRLILLLIVSIPLLLLTQNVMIKNNNEKIYSNVCDTAIKLMELTSLNLDDAKYQSESNKILAKSQAAMLKNKFVSDASLSFYNTKRKTLIAKSYTITIAESNELTAWWQSLSDNNKNATPNIHFSAGAQDFIEKHKQKRIYAEKIVCVNSVLFPSSLTVRDDDGKKLNEYSEITPSVHAGEFKQRIELVTVGNDKSSVIYGLMSDYYFDTENANSVKYNEDKFENVQLVKKQFELNGNTYQLDCCYHFNFWQNTIIYILIIELVLILLSALSAFINTKETMSIYR